MDEHDTLRPEAPTPLRPTPLRAGVLGSFRGGSGAAQRLTRETPHGGSVSEASEGGADRDDDTSPGMFVAWDEFELEREGCAACGGCDEDPGIEYCPAWAPGDGDDE